MRSSSQEIVAKLRAARLRQGVPQAQVAGYIGTTQSAIARLESAQSDPRLGTLSRYAEAVGLQLTLVAKAPSTTLASIADDVRIALASNDHDTALRHVIQLLDDLKHHDLAGRRHAVHGEPEPVQSRRWDALLAGVAEHVSRQQEGFAVPGWAAAPGRFLDHFWFVIEDVLGQHAPGLAALAFIRSPAAFANRGVFIDSRSLASV